MSLKKNKTFVRKPYSKELYKWSPDSFEKSINKVNKINLANIGCTATPRSQGEDWIVSYMSQITIDNNHIQHIIAYVECDYVQ